MTADDNLITAPKEEDLGALISAFRNFNETAASLNLAYRHLEERIEQLTQQLEEKDRELYSRFRELDRVTRYLNSLLESISSGVVAVDLEGKVTIFNRAASEMTGIAADAVIGKPYQGTLAEGDAGGAALQTLSNGPEVRGVERVLPGKGTQVQVATSWVVDSLGERIGVVEIFDDVTSIRRLEERFEQQKTLTALGEMAAAVAHELRNPLSGIGGFAALLKQDLAADPDKLRLVDKILQGVRDLDRVAGNLLFLTRRTELRPSELDLKQLLFDLTQLLEAEANSKSLEVSISTRFPEENVMVAADGELLRMVFTNLGRNALQAVKSGGEISFRLDWQLLNNRVRVEVKDDGCGIPEENLPRLFSPFFTTRSEGTGLGLALVKKAVDLHQGNIEVASQPQQGTTFTVSLPIKRQITRA